MNRFRLFAEVTSGLELCDNSSALFNCFPACALWQHGRALCGTLPSAMTPMRARGRPNSGRCRDASRSQRDPTRPSVA